MAKCKGTVEVWSRTVGFFRPVQDWSKGKVEEFHDRKTYKLGGEDEKPKSGEAVQV
jgi:anaerobic ribonucleoside-triphosphate reductase